ncbi:hypothetical protein B7P43_G07057, partial [Cryptotermes secundus]
MATAKRLHDTSGSERETVDSVVESGDAEITDRSKENNYNSIQIVKSEIKSEARTNKSPDSMKGLTIPKIFLVDDNKMTNVTHVDGICMDERLKQKVIKGTSHLQSSVNAAEGLGTRALMTIYVGLSVSAIFLPVLLIKWLGCKWTLVVSQVAYMPYIGAQMYAKFYTLIPTALLVGLGGGPLWCSQSVYIKRVAETYAERVGLPPATILARFFGIFFMLYQTSEVWGNLISSSVFSAGKSQEDNNNINITDVLETCGYNFCPGSEATGKNPNLERPANEKIYTVASIYLACMVL